MLALPKNRPLLVEEEGGGGFWICDACSGSVVPNNRCLCAYRGRARLAHAVCAVHVGGGM
jgi:hypothetical protein